MNFVRHHTSVRHLPRARAAVATHEHERAAIAQVAWIAFGYIATVALLIRGSLLA